MKKQKNIFIISIVIFSCIIMGVVDAIIQPGYLIKSIIKLVLFSLLPIIYSLFNKEIKLYNLFKPNKKGIFYAILTGIGVYVIVLGAFLIFRNVFDFSSLTKTLTSQTGVNKDNFIFVAIYISFINSLLEEFFFRGFSFLTLKKSANKIFVYNFSAFMFAMYHASMMIGWFNIWVLILALVGLFIGGIIFNYFDEKFENIYLSWLIHMFANFATNTIGFILFLEM